jgi:hypothetical protein
MAEEYDYVHLKVRSWETPPEGSPYLFPFLLASCPVAWDSSTSPHHLSEYHMP